MKHLQRPNYPLTDETKDFAKELVEAWNQGKLEQYSTINMIIGGKLELQSVYSEESVVYKFESDKVVVALLELNQYGLVKYTETRPYLQRPEKIVVNLLLLEELREAIKNNFFVSDYFLTMNVQGNIFIENSQMGDVYNKAFNSGVIQYNVHQIADELTNKLGEEFLSTQKELRDAIEELRLSDEQDRQGKYGKVISQLGNSLGHVANFGTILQTLEWFIKIFPK